jgi:mutator protein MutT
MTEPEQLPIRYGAVAVLLREDGRMLVIRRSKHVLAPLKYCFPGGGIEPGEREEDAVVREVHEELGIVVKPARRLWECVTAWRVHLAWWLVTVDGIAGDVQLRIDEREVESVHWLTPEEMAVRGDLLASNLEFLELVAKGEIKLELIMDN